MSEAWRTNEPEIGQVALLCPEEQALVICTLDSNGKKVWDNHRCETWEVGLLQWLPITTPEEERLKAKVRELDTRVRELEDGIEEHMNGEPGHAADRKLYRLIG
jgi:hypothetical protein